MINLIKNELIKIFSKKAIYIYSLILFCTIIFISIYAKSIDVQDGGYYKTYIETLENELGTYDLTNPGEILMYISDRTMIDTDKLSRDYKVDDPEYYYIQEVIDPLIYEKYQLEYVDKDIEGAKSLQLQIDEEIKKLDKFDWKEQILSEKDEIKNDIKEVETLLLNDKDNKEYQMMLETLNIKLWCLDYRLDNEVAYSYGNKSYLIDLYEEYSIQYLGAIKDESLIKDKKQLIANREIVSNYEITKYKLENDLVDEQQDMVEFIVSSMAYVDGFIVIAMIIICGSIISEEFNKGTIKQLLLKPFSRRKILTSKIIASLIALFIFIVLYEVVFILSNCYEYGSFSSIFGTNVIYDFNLGKVREVSVIGQSIYGLLSVMPAYLIIFAVVLFVGALTTSSVASMCTGFGLLVFYDLFSMFLSAKVLSFVPFYTWDLSPYMYGGISTNSYATLGKSLIIDIITMLFFVVMTYIIFKRKDIKNQ